jgi:hypothetical protein
MGLSANRLTRLRNAVVRLRAKIAAERAAAEAAAQAAREAAAQADAESKTQGFADKVASLKIEIDNIVTSITAERATLISAQSAANTATTSANVGNNVSTVKTQASLITSLTNQLIDKKAQIELAQKSVNEFKGSYISTAAIASTSTSNYNLAIAAFNSVDDFKSEAETILTEVQRRYADLQSAEAQAAAEAAASSEITSALAGIDLNNISGTLNVGTSLRLLGGSDNLTITEVSGDWKIANAGQNNHIKIYDGGSGIEILEGQNNYGFKIDNYGVKAQGPLVLQNGTDLERPATPATGSMRFNTDSNAPEYYDGSAWISIVSSIGGLDYVDTWFRYTGESGEQSTAQVYIPSSAQIGDFAVMTFWTDLDERDVNTPSSWTYIGKGSATENPRSYMFAKVLEAGDAGGYYNVSITGGADFWGAATACFRPDAKIRSWEAHNYANTKGPDPLSLSLSTSGVNKTPALAFASVGGRTGPQTPSLSWGAAAVVSGSSGSPRIGYVTYPAGSTVQSHSATTDDQGRQSLNFVYFTFS